MKELRWYLLFCFVIVLLPIHAQEEQDTLFAIKGKRQDHFILDINLKDGWLNTPQGVMYRWWSPGFSLSAMNDIRFGNVVGIGFGLAFTSHNVHSNARLRPFFAGATAETNLIPIVGRYSKNKITTNYIEAPFELRIRTRGESPFRLYLGGRFGYMLNIYNKIVDRLGKRKYYNFPNIDPHRWGLTAMLGYGRINVKFYYGLNSLIRKGMGDELVPYSIGLSIFAF
jgi:hypothetical protein